MRAADVARRLGVSLATVYRLAKEGRIPSHQPAPRVLAFERADVEAYWEECRKGPPPAAGKPPKPRGARPAGVPRVY